MTHELPMACADSDLHLVALAYGETTDVPADVQAHVDSCERCRGELDAIAQTRAFAQQLPFDEPSEEMDARILAAADDFLAGREIGATPIDEIEAHDEAPAAKVVPLFDAPRPAAAAPARTIERESAPPIPFAPPKRSPRRWIGPFAAAAVLGLVIGGTTLLKDSQELATYAPAAEPKPVEAPAAIEEGRMGAKELASKAAPPVLPSEPAAAAAPTVPAEKQPPVVQREESGKKKNAAPRQEPLLDGLVGAGGDVAKGDSSGLGGLGLRGGGIGGGGMGYGSGSGIGIGSIGRGRGAPDEAERPVPVKPADVAANTPAPSSAPTEPRLPVAPLAVKREETAPPPPPIPASPAPERMAVARLDEAPVATEFELSSTKKDASVSDSDDRAAVVQSAPLQKTRAAETAAPAPAAPRAMSAPPSSLANPDLSRWQRYVEMARLAARQGDHLRAEQLYALVAGSSDAPAPLVEEALAGRSESLFQLGREDEAIAVAELLATRFPSRSAAPMELRRRARAMPAPASVPPTDD